MTPDRTPSPARRFRAWRDYPVVRLLPQSMRKTAKAALSYLPQSHHAKLLAHWADLRVWRRTHLRPDTPVHADRYALYAALVETHLPPRFIFLEFGCAFGENVHRWARLSANPDLRFVGFDTFTGMPEDWRGLGWKVQKGAWDQGGTPPKPQDPRVSFVKGTFQESLEPYIAETDLLRAHDHYVIHIDADLYSATLFVLCVMRPVLHRATVIFDEFDCVLDEMKALDDFCRSFGMTYKVIGTAVNCEKVAIQFC